MITETTKKVAETIKPDLIINTVDAIQNGRSSYLGDTFDRDGWHLNKTYGRYTAGCIWYEKLTGDVVLGNPYHPETISDYVAEVCQTAAHEACLHPYQVTDLSGRFTDPDPKTDVGTVLAEWEFSNTNAVEDAYIGTFTGLPDNSKVPYSETITYNLSFAASQAHTIETDITLGSDTNGFRVRMTCCMEYQVNGRHFQHPRTQSVQTLKNSPKISIID